MTSVPGTLLPPTPAARPGSAGAPEREAAHGFTDFLSNRAGAARPPSQSGPVSRDTRDGSRDSGWRAQGKHLEKSAEANSSADEVVDSLPDEKPNQEEDACLSFAGFLPSSVVPLVVTIEPGKANGETAEPGTAGSVDGGSAKAGHHVKALAENALREARRNGGAADPNPVERSATGTETANSRPEVQFETTISGAGGSQSAATSLQSILAQMSAASGFSAQGATDRAAMPSTRNRTDSATGASNASDVETDGIDPADTTKPSLKRPGSVAHGAGRGAEGHGIHDKGDAAEMPRDRARQDGLPTNAAAKGSETGPIPPSGGRMSGPAQTVIAAIASDPRWRPENVAGTTPSLVAGKPAAGTTLQIQLNPGHLGTVNATMRMVGSHLSVELSAETEAAAKHLATDRKEIQDALRDLGFDLDQIVITPPQVAPASAQPSASAADGSAFQRSGNEAGSAFGGARQNGQAANQNAQGGTNAASVGARESGSPAADRSAGVYI